MKRFIGAIALCISAPASAQTLADLNLPFDVPSCPTWTTQLFPPCTAAPGPDAKIFASDASHEFLVPLTDIPTASYVDQINATVSGLTTSVTQLSNEFATVGRQIKTNERGVSMAFALSGIGDLASDEHMAVGFNWGTFQGQSSLAAGVAIRASAHLSFNAGIAGNTSGGNVGGRAGVRWAW